MASIAPSVKTMETLNPCCTLWRTRCMKMEEKRSALRQGVEILKGQIDRLQLENANLKKASDEEQARLDVLEEEKGKEASLRISLEKEIASLKSEKSSTKLEVDSKNVDLDREATDLRTCISEREVEIARLMQLLAEEITRADTEKKAAELERNNAAELQKSLEYEKRKADEATKMANAAAKEAEDGRLQLETLKNEVEKTNLQLEEVTTKLEAEKVNAIKEKTCSDEKRVKEEQRGANNLLKQLEEEKQKVESLQKEMQEIMSSKRSVDSSELDVVKRKLETEKKKVTREKRHVEEEKARVIEQKKIAEETEKRVSEETCRADKLLMQLEEEKQKVAKLQKEMLEVLSSQKVAVSSELDELKRNLEEEKKKAVREQTRVEEEKVKVMEQRRMAEANKKWGSEEKCRADNLLLLLEEEKKKVGKLQREMLEVLSSQKASDSSELDELKRSLEEEKKKAVQEQRRVEEEKLRVLEQRRIAEEHERRSSEEKCRADNLLQQLEEEKQKVEILRKEILDVSSSEKASSSSKLDELKRNLEEEKKKAVLEQRRAEEEKARVVEQRRIAQENEKRGYEEKCRADNLLLQLEEEKQKVEKLREEIQVVMSSQKTGHLDEVNKNLKAEKKKAAKERKRADLAISSKEEQKRIAEANIKNAMEEKCRADRLFEELESSRSLIENFERKLNKVNEMLEAERKEVAKQKKRADIQKLKLDEQGKIVTANEMRIAEEKCRGDNLLLELENARQKLQDMEHELHQVKLCRGLVGTSSISTDFVVNEQAARVNLLQEQLKFEKKRMKHAKEVAKLEKHRKHILQQELQRLKQDFQCLLDHLSMLSDIYGARNGVTNVAKKSRPSQLHFRGDEELRMSSLSIKDVSGLLKPNMRFVHAGNREESTSGMENVLDPLQGGSREDILPSSALNSNTASFSDEQLMGSQERVSGSVTMSAGLSVENTNEQATKLGCCNDCCRQRNGEKVGDVGKHGIKSPVEPAIGHAKKRRKILDEFESIKCLHFEGKSIFQEAEKKLFALHKTLFQPMINESIEKENSPLPLTNTNLCGNPEWSSKKGKPPSKPEVALQRAGDSNAQIEVDKVFAPSATEIRESSQPLQVLWKDHVKQNEDALMSFEQAINGDYMKLLDLDDAVAEECFRVAMERPLSPNLPVFDMFEFGQKVGANTPNMPVSGNNEATHQQAFSAHNKNLSYFVLFSDMEDFGSIARIYGATRTCVARCLFLQSNWSVQDILGALLLEKDLRPREKACVLFSLILLNFSAVSASKPVNFQIHEQMNSFAAHIHTVLFDFDKRDLYANFCDFHELLTLGEDFVVTRKVVSNNEVPCDLDGCGSSIEIMHKGEKCVLWPKMASTDLVVAGSIILASISKAVGHYGSVCEVSPKILQIGRTEYSLALSILHTFAYICGEEYFTNSNYTSVMKVVKAVVTFMEGSLAENANKNLQSRDNDNPHQFTQCVKCPFSEGTFTLDYVSSELLEELQRRMVPQDPAVSAHSSNREAFSCFLGDVLSSLELITSIMGWEWVHGKIVPKLFRISESSHDDRVFSTALAVLLGDIGKLGVEARGYDDTGVEDIKRYLLHLLCQTASASMGDKILPTAIVYELIGLYPKGHEMLQNGINVKFPPEGVLSASASSDVVSNFLSSLSSEQITSLAGLVNPDR